MEDKATTNQPAEAALNAAAEGTIDQEKLAKMREALKKFKGSKDGETTISGSEALDEHKGFTGDGKDVDWSEYDLDYSVKHLYPTAHYRETPQGMKWVALVDEFISTERDYRSYGKRVNGHNGQNEYLNLGQYLNDILNNPEDWKLVSLLPGSSGRAGILLQRKLPIVLPDPLPLKKSTEVEAPTDPELGRLEQEVFSFMKNEDLTPTTPVKDDRGEGWKGLEDQALEINPPTLRDPGPIGSQTVDYEVAPLAEEIGKDVTSQVTEFLDKNVTEK